MISGYSEVGTGSSFVHRYLSRKPKVWGWASWSDRIHGFSPEINPLQDSTYRGRFGKGKALGLGMFESLIWPLRMALAQRLGTWDYQWALHVITNFGYSVAPTENLIRNLGFGQDSTNTLLTPPFIVFDLLEGNSWEIMGSSPVSSVAFDRREFRRRIRKMISKKGLVVLFWKFLK